MSGPPLPTVPGSGRPSGAGPSLAAAGADIRADPAARSVPAGGPESSRGARASTVTAADRAGPVADSDRSDDATEAGGATGADAAPDPSPGRSRWRRYRLPLLVFLVILLVALFIGLASARNVRGELDPAAVDPSGSRALATLLGDRGVEVRRVVRLDDALDAATSRTMVLIPFPNLLPPETLSRVGDLETAQVTLVGPSQAALAAVTERVRVRGDVEVTSRAPDCAVDAATAAGSAEIGGRTYTVDAPGLACYPAGDDATLAIAQTRGGARLVVLGSGDPLTNGQLDRAGNAALALNLLGADGSADEVRWLVPSPGAAATDDQPSLSDIVPGWAEPAAVQLLIAALLAAGWRARRLGPPVTEPLPVVVRAAEAVEGRARLYRRAQARDRAADALRAGARSRLIPRLGLGRGVGGEPDPAAVVDAIAQRTRLPDSEIHAALYGSPPTDDAALVGLADALDSIVRTTLNPEVRRP